MKEQDIIERAAYKKVNKLIEHIASKSLLVSPIVKCSGACGRFLSQNNANFSYKTKGKFHKECKDCHNIKRRSYYANSPQQKSNTLDRNRNSIKRNKEFVKSYLNDHPCVDCNEPDIVVLEFDHVRGKKINNVSTIMANNTLQALIREISKCDVVCANCHRRRTASRAGYFKLG